MSGDSSARRPDVHVRAPEHAIEHELLRRWLPRCFRGGPPAAMWLALDAETRGWLGGATLDTRGHLGLHVLADARRNSVTELARVALAHARDHGLAHVRCVRPVTVGGRRHAALTELGFVERDRVEHVAVDVRVAHARLAPLVARHAARPSRAARHALRPLAAATPSERAQLAALLSSEFGRRFAPHARDVAEGGTRYDAALSHLATAGGDVHAALLVRAVRGHIDVDAWVASPRHRGTRAHVPLLAEVLSAALARGSADLTWSFAPTRHGHTAALAARLGATPLPARCVLEFAISRAQPIRRV